MQFYKNGNPIYKDKNPHSHLIYYGNNYKKKMFFT